MRHDRTPDAGLADRWQPMIWTGDASWADWRRAHREAVRAATVLGASGGRLVWAADHGVLRAEPPGERDALPLVGLRLRDLTLVVVDERGELFKTWPLAGHTPRETQARLHEHAASCEPCAATAQCSSASTPSSLPVCTRHGPDVQLG